MPYGTISLYKSVIIKVLTEDVRGIGEASIGLPVETGETQEILLNVISQHLTPAIMGEDPLDIDKIHRKMDKAILDIEELKQQ